MVHKEKIIIAGAGISGMLCAFLLQQQGYDCILLDAEKAGEGSISVSTGILQFETDIPLSASEYPERIAEGFNDCRLAIHQLKSLVLQYDLACDWKDVPGICLAFDDAQLEFLRKESRLMHAHGFENQIQDEWQLKRQYGLHAKAAMITNVSAQINAPAFVKAALPVFEAMGGNYMPDSQLVGYVKHNDSLNVEIRSKGLMQQLECSRLIISTGYNEQFLPELDYEAVVTYTTTVMLEKPNTEFFNIWDCNEPYFYIRSDKPGKFLVGGLDGDLDLLNDQKKTLLAEQKLREYFHSITGISHFTTQKTTASKFINTPDGLPFIGQYDESEPVYFALPFGGNGIVFSMIAARELLDKFRDNDYHIPFRYSLRRF